MGARTDHDRDVEAQFSDSEKSTSIDGTYPSTRSSSLTLFDAPITFKALEKEDEVSAGSILIAWDPLDPQHPFNWSRGKKMGVLLAACTVTLLAGMNATHIAIINPVAKGYFGVTADQFTLGFSLYMVGVAIAPLFLAPLSELYGRNIIFQTSSVL